MKIAVFFEHADIGSSGSYAERALRFLGHEVAHFTRADMDRVLPGYDLYFRVEDGEYGYRFVKHQHPAVYWTMDTHVPYSRKKILAEAGQYDFLFPCHQSGAALLKGKGYPVYWLPVGADPELHGRIQVPLAYDVASIGKDEGVPRMIFNQEIRERCPRSFIKKAHFRLMQPVYSAAKIGFNQSIRNDLNMRSFEVTAAGAMLLASALEDDSFERLGFVDGKHLVIFRSPKELFEKLDYYLNHEKERAQIAEAGRMLTIGQHTYKHRMQEMLEALKSHGLLKDISPDRPAKDYPPAKIEPAFQAV